MSFLAGLHGAVAAILICSLLLVDEAGIPLPIAPNEMLLLLIGVLISSGAFPLWVILPLAFVAMGTGMFSGYIWARAVGPDGLEALAARVHAGPIYRRAQERLRTASPYHIGACRMLPGVRPYATLIAGAAGVDIRAFMLGALPTLLLWEIIWIGLGILVGLPIADLLGRFEQLAIRGALLILLAVIAWLAVRNTSPGYRGGISRVAPRLRPTLALAVDAAMVLSAVAGLFAIGRHFTHQVWGGWIEIVVAIVVLIALLIAGRGVQTPGERLLATEYWHRLVVV